MSSNEIEHFLNSWKDGVIEIGRVYLEGGDYEKCAEKFISSHYAFDHEEVLFKPTFTKEVIFRNSKELALSYFIGGDIPEDNGFALKPWGKIKLEELNAIEENNVNNENNIYKLIQEPYTLEQLQIPINNIKNKNTVYLQKCILLLIKF